MCADQPDPSLQLSAALVAASRTARARQAGVSAYALTRAEWTHPAHGVVRPLGSHLDQADDWIGVALALAGPRHAIGGWASGRLQGVVHVDGLRFGQQTPVLVHCLDGAQLRRRRQIRPSESWVHDDELIAHDTVSLTTLARAAFDEICDARRLDDAVMVLDSFVARLRGGAYTTLAEVAAVVSRHHKHRGIVQARSALELASERALSPWESLLRLRAWEVVDPADLLVNVPVFSRQGDLLGVPDLLDVSCGLVLESDGAQHRDTQTHAEDNRREETFEDHDLEVVRFGAVDHRDPGDLLRRIRAGRRRALAHLDRCWTVDPPAWWQNSSMATAWAWP